MAMSSIQGDFQTCSNHKNKYFVLFCVDHHELSCEECKEEKHAKCQKVMPLERACTGAKQSDSFLNTMSSLCQIEQVTIEIMQNRKSCLENVKKSVLDVTKAIDQAKEKVIKQIETLKKLVLDDLRKTEEQVLSEITTVLDKTEVIHRTAQKQTELFESIKSNGSDHQAFLLAHTHCESVTELESELEKIGSNLRNYEFVFKAKSMHSRSFSSFGKYEVNEIKCPVKFISINQKQSQTPVQHLLQRAVPSFKHAYDIDLRKDNVCICGVLSYETKLVFIDSKLNRILVYDENKFLTQILLEHKPWSYTLIPTTWIVIMTCHFRDIVKFVDLQRKRIVRDVKIRDSNQGGVAATLERIYVGTKDKICILTTEGVVCGEIETTCGIDKPLTIAFGGAYLYLADKCTIYCISLVGELIYKYKLPASIINLAIDEECFIYVVTNTAGVYVLSYKGELQKIILNDKEKTQSVDFNLLTKKMFLSWKAGICVSVYDFS